MERIKSCDCGSSCARHVQVGDEGDSRDLELFFAQVRVLADACEEPLTESR